MRAGDLRERNTQQLLTAIWSARQISRVELARRSGLARSTVSVIVQELLARDLVRTSHVAKATSGRPPIVLSFNDDRYWILGIDLGASHVSVAAVNLRGVVSEERTRRVDVESDPSAAIATVAALAGEVLAAHGRRDDLIGAGLAVPSPLDADRPEELSQRILPAWIGRSPRVEIEQLLGVPVWMDNDANLGALAEHLWGEVPQVSSLAYIKVSTGVGAGLILDGRVFSGATGIAGEIGHTAIDASGPRCRCGLSGCLEAMIGSRSLAQRLAQVAGAKTPELGDPAAIAQAARGGDEHAARVVAEAGRYLGIAIANLLNLVNPARVVLGGSLTEAGDLLLGPLREAVAERALSTSVQRAEVEIGTLGEITVALGAATQVLQAFLADPSGVGSAIAHPPQGRPSASAAPA